MTPRRRYNRYPFDGEGFGPGLLLVALLVLIVATLR